jgi:hypothetical protein
MLLLIISCSSIKYNRLFNKLIEDGNKKSGQLNILYTINNTGVESNNPVYKEIYSCGTKTNDYLLKQTVSTEKTNWLLDISALKLMRGDIAILLLAEINRIKFIDLLPEDDKIASFMYYKNSSINHNLVFWKWVQEDTKNRRFVISKIKKIIDKK